MVDTQVSKLIAAEEKRQKTTLCLIASENYPSKAVRVAEGSILMSKYSEGYPGKRYYQGNDVIDKIEELAILRATKLFGAEHANVQPYSGSPANLEAYLALIKPGDTIMGMSLPHGGHLTHGWRVSLTGQLFKSVSYTVDPLTQLIDYNEVRKLAKKHRPKLIVAGATAYPRAIDFKKFGEIAREVGAYFVADVSHIAGLIAGGEHQSPVPYADVVTTTTHKTLRGPRGAMILSREKYSAQIDRAVFPMTQGGPHNNTTAAIAIALGEAATSAFKKYAHQVVLNARALAAGLQKRGFTLVTGGTDTHLVLVDLTKQLVSGREVAVALEKAGIVCNANTIPFDPRKPFDPSGIRLGTPALTTRGMKEKQMEVLAGLIAEVVVVAGKRNEKRVVAVVRKRVVALCRQFPLRID